MNILDTLNAQQAQAVTTTEGYVRVIAGAGSGKTKALTVRYAYLVNELGISTANILCVTFTNKAANEMKRRVRGMIGDNDTGLICTFHGFCVQLLREEIHAINYPQNFVVLDEEDTEAILKAVYDANGIKSKNYTFNQAREEISERKVHRNFEGKFDYLSFWMDLNIEKLKEEYENAVDLQEKVFLGYLYEQKKCYGLDYDDLITVALHILENRKDKRIKWQERMMYVMVDEFQDVSSLNYELANVLSGYHRNLFIVGDPDQTIYSWRGAKVEYILDFDKTHQNTKTIFMNQNYRSCGNILYAANSLIKKNKNRIEKDLIATKEEGKLVTHYHAKTMKEEAEWIAKQIKILSEKSLDVAILYRAHRVSRSLEEALIRNQIPYILYSGTEFYKRKEIKDVLSYLRMILMADDYAFLRVVNAPRRNIGKKRISFLREYAMVNECSMYEALKNNVEHELIRSTKADEFVSLVEKYKAVWQKVKVSDLMTAILSESGYEAMLRQGGEQERLDNLSELKQSVFEYEKTSGEETTLQSYLQSIALYTNTDRDEKEKKVKLMTIHAAKGLEFDDVFLCGMNEGIFPSNHVDTMEKMEEERRLAYVAYTRAKRELFLTEAEGVNDDDSFRFPSRFIFDTNKKYINTINELPKALVKGSENYIRANEEKIKGTKPGFQIGDLVCHKVFGRGKIVDIKEDITSFVIKFDKFETERNLSFRAPLEKVEN